MPEALSPVVFCHHPPGELFGDCHLILADAVSSSFRTRLFIAIADPIVPGNLAAVHHRANCRRHLCAQFPTFSPDAMVRAVSIYGKRVPRP